MIDQFKERKVRPMKFHSILLNEINPLYDRNERISKVLSANYD